MRMVARVVSGLAAENVERRGHSREKEEISEFHSLNVSHMSLISYFERIFTHLQCSVETVIFALILLERLVDGPEISVAPSQARNAPTHAARRPTPPRCDLPRFPTRRAALSLSCARRAIVNSLSQSSSSRFPARRAAQHSLIRFCCWWHPRRSRLVLTPHTVHRMSVTALMVAAKTLGDFNEHSNAVFACLGGVSMHELNRLEVSFLFRMNFAVHVSASEFTAALRSLPTRAARAHHQFAPSQQQLSNGTASRKAALMKHKSPTMHTTNFSVKRYGSASACRWALAADDGAMRVGRNNPLSSCRRH